MNKTAEDIIKEFIPNGIVNVKGKGDGKPQYKAEIEAIKKCMEAYASQSPAGWVRASERIPIVHQLYHVTLEPTDTNAQVKGVALYDIRKQKWSKGNVVSWYDETPSHTEGVGLDKLKSMCEAAQNLFDQKKSNPKNKGQGFQSAWNHLANSLYDANEFLNKIPHTEGEAVAQPVKKRDKSMDAFNEGEQLKDHCSHGG